MTASNTYGRQVVIPLLNKSGGGVIAGDVVVIDTANNDAFTTDTAGAFIGGVGVAQETIASNATGRILTAGYAALVNVNASVTRGQFGKTHTVAKQATGTATRGVGTFCQWLTGGTTPDALVYPVDLLGSSLTNPMTTKGDIIIADTGGTPTRLAAGATAGMLLRSAGSAAFETWALPPGYEFDYVQITSAVSITATTEGTADTVVTGSAVSYDGSTIVMVEYWFPYYTAPTSAVVDTIFVLYDGASSIGFIGLYSVPSSASTQRPGPVRGIRRLTPSNASHTYSIRAYVSTGTGSVGAGAGGAGAHMPGFIRILKV